ncbi:MAG: TonB-dependent receptor plug domain-containing protein [Novosphingobium sp.]
MRFNASRKAALAATAATIAILFADPALAQAQPQAADDTATAADDSASIVVIGTRRTDRSSTNSASPVDVISSQELSTQASSNLLDVIKNVVPSIFVAQNSISDASTFVHSPSLRGLPADNVLVMVNGKRLNRSALVQVYSGGDTGLGYGSQGADISSIPSIAIGNLQVLRDGATAQYGSDAIAGVMNYGVRKDKGIEVQGRYGQYFRNGDGKSYQIAANAGFGLGERAFVNVSGEFYDDGQTSRGVTRPTALAYSTNNPTNAAQLPFYPLPAQIWGNSPGHGWKILVNSELELSDNAKFYVVGNAANSKASESFNYRASTDAVLDATGSRLINTTGMTSAQLLAAGDIVLCGRGFLNYQASGVDPLTTAYPAAQQCGATSDPYFHNLYPAGFTPIFVGVVNQLWGVAGIKGSLGAGTYDVSVSGSKNSLDLAMYNSLNTAFSPNNPASAAPYNTATQTSFNFGRQAQKELDGNIDLTYPVEVGFAKPITLSGGFEYRKETYQLTVSDFQGYAQGGASGYGGVSPSQAGTWSQSNVAFYAGAETDILSNWTVGIAGRYEHYNTFGSATVGKINTRFEFAPGYAIRATFGTGFHAPSPGQQHNSTLTTNFVAGNSIQTGTFPVDSAASLYYGAKALTPEKSTNFGVGFTAEPVHGLTFTVDYYNIKVRDKIFVTQPFRVTAADLIASSALNTIFGGTPGGDVSYFTNGLSTLTRGVDVVASYNTEAMGGKLNLSLAYNHNANKVLRFNNNVINGAQIANIVNLAPHDVAHFTMNYSHGGFSLTARENYYGSWVNAADYGNSAGTAGANGGALQHFGGKATTDLDVTYDVSKELAITLGANNLFNTFPDKLNNNSIKLYPVVGGSADGQVYARNGGPFGMNGGLWYVRVKVRY